MKISGNQTALREIFKLLDNTFKDPFKCKYPACGCNENSNTKTRTLACDYNDEWFEDIYGCSNYIFEIEYDGSKITKTVLLHRDYSNANLLNGCVK